MTDGKIRLCLAQRGVTHGSEFDEGAEAGEVAAAFIGLLGVLYDNHVGAMMAVRDAVGIKVYAGYDHGFVPPEEISKDGPRTEYGAWDKAAHTSNTVDLCGCGMHVKEPGGKCLYDDIADAAHPKCREE